MQKKRPVKVFRMDFIIHNANLVTINLSLLCEMINILGETCNLRLLQVRLN